MEEILQWRVMKVENKMKHIVQTYRTEQEAKDAVNKLKDEGYTSEEISIISRYEGEVGAATEAMDASPEKPQSNTDAGGEELFVQAGLFASGGTVGIPGIGPSLAAGPIAAAMTGDLTQDNHDILINTLVDMGIPAEEARQYENDIREGRYFILLQEK
jgi:hypothetical protein